MGVSHPCGGRRMKDAPAGVSGCRVAPPTGGGGRSGETHGWALHRAVCRTGAALRCFGFLPVEFLQKIPSSPSLIPELGLKAVGCREAGSRGSLQLLGFRGWEVKAWRCAGQGCAEGIVGKVPEPGGCTVALSNLQSHGKGAIWKIQALRHCSVFFLL